MQEESRNRQEPAGTGGAGGIGVTFGGFRQDFCDFERFWVDLGWNLVDLGPKRRLEGHGAPKKPPGRALGTSKGATEQKSAVFGCLFGAILEPKLGPEPPRAVFKIVKKKR